VSPSQGAQDFTTLLYERQDHVTTITLNRPERRNALNRTLYRELERAFLAASADPETRCVIVTGADPTFCAGEDVKELMAEQAEATAAMGPVVRYPPTPAGQAIALCEKPVIAAVNGAAVGWGMEIALLADLRIASERASFAELFIKRGLISDLGGLWRLPAIVGPEKAAELLFTGDPIDAAEAERIRLVGRVTAHAELMPQARALAQRIAANPPLALRYMKEGLRRGAFGDPAAIGSWAIEVIRRLFLTEDHREGVAAYFEKRPPVFTGR